MAHDSDFMRDGIRASFYTDARQDPCVEFSTVMGLYQGTFCFAQNSAPDARLELARKICEAISSINGG